MLWGSIRRRRENDFRDLINFIIIIVFNIIMGNYFKVPDGAKTNKKFVKFFRKCKIYSKSLNILQRNFKESSNAMNTI